MSGILKAGINIPHGIRDIVGLLAINVRQEGEAALSGFEAGRNRVM